MCAKKRPNESQAKRMKEGFFFEGLTSALSDSDKSRTSGRHSTKDSPQYLTILAKVKKASRNWHFSPLKISKDALRENGKSSCAKKNLKYKWYWFTSLSWQRKEFCLLSKYYIFSAQFFFECILAVGHLHGAASELPPFDSQILRVLANNRE